MRALPPVLVMVVLAGCPGDDGPENAPTLFLAPDGSELAVRLVEQEPTPY